MIFLYLIAAVSAIFTFALGVLPGADFLPLPTAAYDAVETVGGWLRYVLGLAGSDVQDTLYVIIPLVITINMSLLLWDILRTWKPPIIGKYL